MKKRALNLNRQISINSLLILLLLSLCHVISAQTSAIDWNSPGWTKTDIQGNSINIWNGTGYLTNNGSVGDTEIRNIDNRQDFLVKAQSGAAGLTSSESVTTGTSTSTYRTNASSQPSYIELTVAARGYNDKTYIQFIDTAKFEFDIADAPKLSNAIFDLATLSSDSVLLSINVISGDSCQFDIPLQLWNTWEDSYSFSWNLTDDLYNKYSMNLEDKFTNNTYSLNEDNLSFNFTISNDPATKDINRFVLHFQLAPIDGNIAIETVQSCEFPLMAEINLSSSQLNVDYVLMQNNQQLKTLPGTGEMLIFDLDSSNLVVGVNSFVIRASNTRCAGQSIDFTTTIEVIEAAQLGAPVNAVGCNNSSVTLMMQAPVNAALFRWYNKSSDLIPIAETINPEFVTPLLTKTTSYYVSAVNANGCETAREEIIASIQPTIDLTNNLVYNDSICNSETLLVTVDSSIPKMKYFISNANNIVSDTIEGNGGAIDLVVQTSNINPGNNTLLANVYNELCSETLPINNIIDIYKSPVATSTVESVSTNEICNVGNTIIHALGAKANEQYCWYSTIDDTSPILMEPNGIFETPILNQSHVYFVSIINETGCESSRTPVNVNVNNLPVPFITVDTLELGRYILTSSSINGNQWYLNDKLLEGENSQVLTTNEPGYYWLEVQSGACSVMSDTIQIDNTILGTQPILEHVDIEIYPNPTTDKVIISLPGKSSSELRTMLIDMDGSEQYNVENIVLNDREFVIDLLPYKAGIYILKIYLNSKIYSYRLIKQ